MSANAVFGMIRSGGIRVNIGQRYALDDAVRAHEDTEAGRTAGSSILMP